MMSWLPPGQDMFGSGCTGEKEQEEDLSGYICKVGKRGQKFNQLS
jgi:hypothetical protein